MSWRCSRPLATAAATSRGAPATRGRGGGAATAGLKRTTSRKKKVVVAATLALPHGSPPPPASLQPPGVVSSVGEQVGGQDAHHLFDTMPPGCKAQKPRDGTTPKLYFLVHNLTKRFLKTGLVKKKGIFVHLQKSVDQGCNGKGSYQKCYMSSLFLK